MERVENWIANRPDAKQSGHIHNVFRFFSCKGGTGLTLAATNLACTLNEIQDSRVIAVDFVLQHGNIAEFFDYLGEREPKRVIYSPSSKREFINALVVEPK